MSNTWALTKILVKGMFSFESKKKNKKNKVLTILFGLLLAICFIPFAIQAKDLATFLGETGTSLMIEMLVIMNTLVLIVISLMSNIGVVFFSKDNDVLLHLPIKPREIFFARNIIVLISCYFLTLLFFLPSAIGAGIGIEANWSYYLFVSLVTILLPIIPCIITSMVTLLIVKYLKFIRNKDVMTYLTMAVALLIGLGFFYGMDYLMPVIDETTDAFALIENYKIFINNLGWLFPYSLPLMKVVSLTTTVLYKIIYLFGIIGISLFLVYLGCFIADKIYFSALLKINSTGAKKKKFNESKFRKKGKKENLTIMLAKRELKVIVRTPIYLLNMLLPIIFPLMLIFIVKPILNNFTNNDLETLSYYAKDYILEGVFIIVLVCTMGNFASSVMYSKDGSTNKNINYLPIPFIKNFIIKVFVSTLISIVPYLALICYAQSILRFEIIELIFPVLTGLLLIVSVNFIGVFLDVNRPKIKWNSESEAVKTNFNVFVYMILSLLYSALAFVIKEYTVILSISTIGIIISLVYKNESIYIDKLS